MIYPLHTKKRSKRHNQFFFFIIFICFLIVLLFHNSVGKALSYMTKGFNAALYAILPAGFHTAHDLALSNQALQAQINLLVAQNADRNILANENERLRSSFERNEKQKIVYSTVLKRPPESAYDTFILDAGSEDGVRIDDDVVFGSVAIGRIVELGTGYSKARLFSSSGNTFDGMLSGSINIQAKGLGGGAFEAVVPLGVAVSVGDSLILPSISSRIFGLVQSIEEKTAEGFKRILFSLPININQIDSVGVIIK